MLPFPLSMCERLLYLICVFLCLLVSVCLLFQHNVGIHTYTHTYRLTHGFRRYTGYIPEVLISTARGRSLRTVLISTEGISLYTSKAMC